MKNDKILRKAICGSGNMLKNILFCAPNLRNHCFKRFHNFRAFGLLIIGEAARYNDDSSQYHSKVQLLHFF